MSRRDTDEELTATTEDELDMDEDDVPCEEELEAMDSTEESAGATALEPLTGSADELESAICEELETTELEDISFEELDMAMEELDRTVSEELDFAFAEELETAELEDISFEELETTMEELDRTALEELDFAFAEELEIAIGEELEDCAMALELTAAALSASASNSEKRSRTSAVKPDAAKERKTAKQIQERCMFQNLQKSAPPAKPLVLNTYKKNLSSRDPSNSERNRIRWSRGISSRGPNKPDYRRRP